MLLCFSIKLHIVNLIKNENTNKISFILLVKKNANTNIFTKTTY